MKKQLLALFKGFLLLTAIIKADNTFGQASPTDGLAGCGTTAAYINEINQRYFATVNPNAPPATTGSPLFVAKSSFPAALIEHCGAFNLYYEDKLSANQAGFADPTTGAERKNTLCAVLTYIQSVINIPAGVTIDIDIIPSRTQYNPTPAGDSWLARASPYFPPAYNTTSGIYAGNVHDAIVNHITSTNYDAELEVNFNDIYDGTNEVPVTYWDNYNNTSQTCAYDLYSILLHEFTHSLGWVSNIVEDATTHQAKCGSTNNNEYTLFDWQFLYYGNIGNPASFEHLLAGTQTSPIINASVNANTNPLRTEKIWLYNTANPHNQPVYAGSYPGYPQYSVPSSFLSHMDLNYLSFTGTGQYSPGSRQKYVMGPFTSKEEEKRTWTLPELRALLKLGYALNPIFAASTSLSGVQTNLALLTNNTPPYRTNGANNKITLNPADAPNFSDAYSEETITPDFTLVNNNTTANPNQSSITINLSADANITDPDGDVISIMKNTLFNIRGCGKSGSSSHSLLTINAAQTSIKYTPEPGFIGRAQFGFNLWDGKEMGAFKVYTIDVKPGSYTVKPGSELVINGDFEEGAEVKQRGGNENLPNTYLDFNLYEGLYLTGEKLSGGHPYFMFANITYGAFVKDSWLKCTMATPHTYLGEFGSAFSNWDTEQYDTLFLQKNSPYIGPIANLAVANNQRYSYIIQVGNPLFCTLKNPTKINKAYTIEFDINSQNSPLPVGALDNINLDFTDNPAQTSPTSVPVFYSKQITFPINTVAKNAWQHVKVRFAYCGSQVSNYLRMYFAQNAYFGFIDNISLKEDTTYTPLVVNAGRDTVIYAGDPPVKLGGNPTAKGGVPPYTYHWTASTGVMGADSLTANPLVNPAVTTTYTVHVTDTIGSCEVTATVVVTPLSACGPAKCTAALSGTITTSPPPNQVYCITGNVFINGKVTFQNSEFRISDNVRIVAANLTDTLVIDHSHLYGCSTMWAGINLGGYGNVVVKNNSLIEDAQYAIKLSDAPPENNNISISNSTFNRNYVGVYLYAMQENSPIETYKTLDIQNTLFTCRDIPFTQGSLSWPNTTGSSTALITANGNDAIQPQYIVDANYSPSDTNAFLKGFYGNVGNYAGQKAYAGIMLNFVGTVVPKTTTLIQHGVVIGKAGTSSNPNFNLFDNLRYGINATEAGLTCYNNTFQNMVMIAANPTFRFTQADYGGIGIYASERQADGANIESPNHRIRVLSSGNYTNKFYDCHFAILDSNYLEQTITGCQIYSTQTVSNSQTVAAHSGQFGIYVSSNHYNNDTISSNTFYNIESPIAFYGDYGPYGVQLLNGTTTNGNGQYSGQVEIDNNTMQPKPAASSFTGAYIGTGITVINNGVNPVTSVSSNTAARDSILNINGNTITNAYSGIDCENWNAKQLVVGRTQGNTISLVDNILDNTAPQYGIACKNLLLANTPSYTAIADNNITGANITNSRVAAIYTSLCSGINEYCNTTLHTYTAMEYDGYNQNTYFQKNTLGKIGTTPHQYGLVLNFNAVLGQQGSFDESTGSTGGPLDNTWVGNWTGTTGGFTGNFKTAALGGSIALNSPMYVRALAGYNPNGSAIALPQDIPSYFYNTGNGSIKISTTLSLPTSCLGLIYLLPPILSPTLVIDIKLMEKVALGQLPMQQNPTQTGIINQNQLFQLLQANSAILNSSPVLQSFYQQSLSTTYGIISTTAQAISDGSYTLALSLAATLNSANPIEANYQNYFNLYVKSKTSTTGLSDADATSLLALANGCPFTDGAVVYAARALYNLTNRSNITFHDNCIAGGNNDRQAAPANSGLSPVKAPSFDAMVYPNPSSTGIVNIAPYGLLDGALQIRVTDLTGKQLYQGNLQIDNGFCNFRLNAESGTYLIFITNTNTNETVIKKYVLE